MAKTTTPATTERHTTVSGRPIKALYTADDLADARLLWKSECETSPASCE